MEKKVLCAGSFYKKAYYYNEEEFAGIPADVKKELRQITTYLSEKVKSDVYLGFYEDGNVYIETFVSKEDSVDYDKIGTELEIKNIYKQRGRLFKALTVWYKVVKLNGKGVIS